MASDEIDGGAALRASAISSALLFARYCSIGEADGYEGVAGCADTLSIKASEATTTIAAVAIPLGTSAWHPECFMFFPLGEAGRSVSVSAGLIV